MYLLHLPKTFFCCGHQCFWAKYAPLILQALRSQSMLILWLLSTNPSLMLWWDISYFHSSSTLFLKSVHIRLYRVLLMLLTRVFYNFFDVQLVELKEAEKQSLIESERLEKEIAEVREMKVMIIIWINLKLCRKYLLKSWTVELLQLGLINLLHLCSKR